MRFPKWFAVTGAVGHRPARGPSARPLNGDAKEPPDDIRGLFRLRDSTTGGEVGLILARQVTFIGLSSSMIVSVWLFTQISPEYVPGIARPSPVSAVTEPLALSRVMFVPPLT